MLSHCMRTAEDLELFDQLKQMRSYRHTYHFDYAKGYSHGKKLAGKLSEHQLKNIRGRTTSLQVFWCMRSLTA
jgi:hypothetical protein